MSHEHSIRRNEEEIDDDHQTMRQTPGFGGISHRRAFSDRPYNLLGDDHDAGEFDRQLRRSLVVTIEQNEAAQRVRAPKPGMSRSSRSSQMLTVMKALKPTLGSLNLANRNPHSSAYVAEEDNHIGWLEAYEKAEKLQDEMPLNPKKQVEAVEFKAPMARLVRRSSRHKMSIKIQQVTPGMFGNTVMGPNRFLKKFHHEEEHRGRANSKGLHLNLRQEPVKGPFSGLAKAFETGLLRKNSHGYRQSGQKVQFSSSLFRNQASLTGSVVKDPTERSVGRLETGQTSIKIKKISPESVTKMSPSNWSSSSPRRNARDAEVLQSPTKILQGKQLRNLHVSARPKVPTDQQSQSIEEVAEAIIKQVDFPETEFDASGAHRKKGRFKIGTQVVEDRKSKSPLRKKRGSVQLDVEVEAETPMVTLSRFGQITLDSFGEQRPASQMESRFAMNSIAEAPKQPPRANLKPTKSSKNLVISPRKHHSSRLFQVQSQRYHKAVAENPGLHFNPPSMVPRYFGDPIEGGSLNLEIPEVEDHSMSDASPAAAQRAGDRLDSVHWGHQNEEDPYSRISPGPGLHNPQALFSPSHNSIPAQQPLFDPNSGDLQDSKLDTVVQETQGTEAPGIGMIRQTAATWSRFFTKDEELSVPLGLLQGNAVTSKKKRLWTTEKLGLGTDSSRRSENLFWRDFQGFPHEVGSSVRDLIGKSGRRANQERQL